MLSTWGHWPVIIMVSWLQAGLSWGPRVRECLARLVEETRDDRDAGTADEGPGSMAGPSSSSSGSPSQPQIQFKGPGPTWEQTISLFSPSPALDQIWHLLALWDQCPAAVVAGLPATLSPRKPQVTSRCDTVATEMEKSGLTFTPSKHRAGVLDSLPALVIERVKGAHLFLYQKCKHCFDQTVCVSITGFLCNHMCFILRI